MCWYSMVIADGQATSQSSTVPAKLTELDQDKQLIPEPRTPRLR